MARMNREEVFAPDEIATVHVMHRVARGAFLMRTDPMTEAELRMIRCDPKRLAKIRCSDKGFLALRTADYLELLDWTAREVVPGKRGHTPETVPPILQWLSLDGQVWSAWVGDFGRMFYHAAGKPQTMDGWRSRVGQRRFHVPRATRRVLAACA